MNEGTRPLMESPNLFTKGMKTSSKQDEAWIMNRLIKQLTDMGFPVSSVHRQNTHAPALVADCQCFRL